MNALPVANMDGYAWGTAGSNFQVSAGNPGIAVGDLASLTDYEARGFLTFDISALPPPPAVVRSAVLTIEQWQVAGNPYPTYGSVVIDHLNMGGSFDILDFGAAALDPGFATVSSNPTLGTINIDVRAQVGADQVAGRTRSSFRLRFTFPVPIVANAVHDSANFNDTEDFATSGNVPKLTIVYTP